MQKLNTHKIIFDLQDLAEGLTLEIFPEQHSRVRVISELEAELYNESINQLFEGHSYEYEFEGDQKSKFNLHARIKGIVIPSNRHSYRGRITPNIYVGRLHLEIVHFETQNTHTISLEVVATKFNKKEDYSYRENYRKMLEDITDKCTDLMMQINSPILQNLTIDYTTDANTLYQRFCFVSSFLNNTEFEEAILRIISNPSTTWTTVDTSIKTSQIQKVNRNIEKQLVNASNRINSYGLEYLNEVGLNSIPRTIQSFTRIESIDTLENRFIKHVLGVFLNFVEDCQTRFSTSTTFGFAWKESKNLTEKLTGYLSYSFFNEVSVANSLKLNSPLLQKRSGYREILNRWLQFDLASKLIWQGGEDVYQSGKRDIATLYEYWIFFQLYDLIINKFNLQSHQNQNFQHLFEKDATGLSLKLKSGKELIIQGETDFVSRNLKIRFSYNRTFKGGSIYASTKNGSITTTLRPDYTLSIWPSSFTEEEAEEEEVVVHIHFDAKYKIENIKDQFTISDKEKVLNRIDERERKGTFKNIDILKMHAYKDAIRRTGGAYILYPGNVEKRFDGFHEVLPGLGAFTINPSKFDTGISGLSSFIDKIIQHLIDRTTQRERISNVSNGILKAPPFPYGDTLRPLSEKLEKSKIDLLKTYVLVGYAKSQQHLEWYISNKIYNFRMNDDVGSLELTKEVVQAKYLLIRESGKEKADQLFIINSKGPRVYSKDKLIELGYLNPSQQEYLVIEIEPCNDWKNLQVAYKEFEEYKNTTGSKTSKAGIPFLVTLDKILYSTR